MAYAITQSVDAGEDLIAVSGDADAQAEAELREALRRAAVRTRGTVIVDLLAATLIDSRIMGVLADWTDRLRGADRRLALLCDNPDLLRVFRVTGLESVLEVFASRAALRATGA